MGWSLGPLLAGLVMDHAEPRVVWYACLAIGLMAAIAFLRLGHRGQRAEGLRLDDVEAAV